jgi:hypothetical protein
MYDVFKPNDETSEETLPKAFTTEVEKSPSGVVVLFTYRFVASYSYDVV